MLYKLISVKDVPEQGCAIVQGAGGREIALFKIDGKIYGLDNACPHMGGPLGEGCIEKNVVTCPWHGWAFDIRTGENIDMFGEAATTIKLEIRDHDVYEVREK